jgi:hypothetical protein
MPLGRSVDGTTGRVPLVRLDAWCYVVLRITTLPERNRGEAKNKKQGIAATNKHYFSVFFIGWE